MQVKLNQAKNVYGKREPAGKVLNVGTEIPTWQADKLKEMGVASEYVAPVVKKKAGKK